RFFGAESELRAVLESRLGGDELGAALADPERSRVYLFGRIGEQSVSLHGERGRLVVETDEGPGQRLALEELGMPSPRGSGAAEQESGKDDAEKEETDERSQQREQQFVESDDAGHGSAPQGAASRAQAEAADDAADAGGGARA